MNQIIVDTTGWDPMRKVGRMLYDLYDLEYKRVFRDADLDAIDGQIAHLRQETNRIVAKYGLIVQKRGNGYEYCLVGNRMGIDDECRL